MKLIRTEDAVGSVLCHDLTQIIKGVTKDAVFRKGHVVQPEDIPVLLSIGKEHLYVWEADESMLHENDAARILCDICKNTMMDESPVKEGKIELAAAADGLFKVDSARLRLVNSFGQMMIATRHGNTPVKKGDKLCGTRIIPLVIEKEKMQRVRELCGDEPLLQLLPYKIKKAAVLATGSEVFHGRIKDTFTPVLEEKLAEFNVEVVYKQVLDDKPEQITAAIKTAIEEKGAEMVLCTGGMSVDPDDRTPPGRHPHSLVGSTQRTGSLDALQKLRHALAEIYAFIVHAHLHMIMLRACIGHFTTPCQSRRQDRCTLHSSGKVHPHPELPARRQ